MIKAADELPTEKEKVEEPHRREWGDERGETVVSLLKKKELEADNLASGKLSSSSSSSSSLSGDLVY